LENCAHLPAYRGHIELGVRGDPDEVKAAMDEIRAEITRRGHPFRETL
jgi:hypothetical protein